MRLIVRDPMTDEDIRKWDDYVTDFNIPGKLLFHVTPEELAQAFNFPADIKITGADWRYDSNTLRLILTSDRFPKPTLGKPIPEGKGAIVNGEWMFDQA
jgi:hypothetical protein